MKSWYSNSDDIELKDEIEKFFQRLMDRKDGN